MVDDVSFCLLGLRPAGKWINGTMLFTESNLSDRARSFRVMDGFGNDDDFLLYDAFLTILLLDFSVLDEAFF